MTLIPENMAREFLNQVERAEHDVPLRTLISADDEGRTDLALSWGGMMLGNEDFGKIKATIRECLNAGHFLSEFEVQRRRFLLPKHLAEFRAMIEEIEAGDSEDG